MNDLNLTIVAILATGIISVALSHVYADNIPGPYFPPTMNLNETQKQWLVKKAMTVPGIKAW